MSGKKLAIVGLAALILAGTGCGARYSLPKNPTSCRSYIEEQADGAHVRFYEGIEEGGDVLYVRRGRTERIFWDNPVGGGVNVFAVQRAKAFGLRRDTTSFIPNPGKPYTDAYNQWLEKVKRASREGVRY